MSLKLARFSALWKRLSFPSNAVTSASWTEALDGTRTLELTVARFVDVTKGDHLLFRDGGMWHDTVITSPAVKHGPTGVQTSIVAKDAVAVNGAQIFVDDRRWNDKPVNQILDALVVATPWSSACTNTAAITFNAFHTTVWAALTDLSSQTGLELETVTNIAPSVPQTTVRLVPRIGNANTGVRFDFGHDLTAANRTVSSDSIVTRLFGFGKSLETDSGGFSRKLDFASINGGKKFVTTSDDVAKAWGMDDGKGGWLWRDGIFEDSNADTPEKLLAETKAKLDELSQPTVTWELSAASVRSTSSTTSLRLGDSLTVVDREINLRTQARVAKRVVNLLNGQATITLGTVGKTLTAATKAASSSASATAVKALAVATDATLFQSQAETTVKRVEQSGSAWDKAAKLAEQIDIENGAPVIHVDGKTFAFDPLTGTFKQQETTDD